MKKLNNLSHFFIFFILFSTLLISCGTEEELPEEAITVSASSLTVPIGSPVTFTANSNIGGDISSNATFYVNGDAITGNSFTPTEVRENNEVYAVSNGLTSNTLVFASTEGGGGTESFTQKVLVEDYTGTWCGYCPRMVSILDYLTDANENIIPVAIHSPGPQDPWVYEFAGSMQTTYNAQGLPKGRINRIHELNQYTFQAPCPNNPSLYMSQMEPYLNATAPLGLAINSTLADNQLTINVKVGFANESVSNPKLIVYLLETDLTHNQVNYFKGEPHSCDPANDYVNMPDPIPNFRQNHVLLKAYTNIYGDDILADQIMNGVYTRNFNVTLPSNIGIGLGGTVRPEKLSIVAFVVGNGNANNNRTVINVQEAHVNENKDFD